MSTVITVSQLKQSCTVAPAKALSNWALSVTWVKETSVLVKLVPTLAPITIGIAVLTCNTDKKINHEIESADLILIGHLLPLETIETITDVQVEELWTSTVKRIPIIRLTIGFDSNGFPWNIVPRGEKKIVCKNAFFTVLWLHSLYRLYSLCCLKRFFKLKESSINYFDILPYLELK